MKQRFAPRGTVLIVVLVIVMLLSLAAYKYLLAMQTEHMAIATQGDRAQAMQSAHSVRDLMIWMLKKSRAERAALGGLTDNPAFFAGNTQALNGMQNNFVGLESDVDAGEPPFGIIGYALPTLSTAGNEETLSSPAASNLDGTAESVMVPRTRYGAINESQKLHLYRLLQWEEMTPGAGVAALMSLPGMDEGTAEALLDWLDADDTARAQGAEVEFYSTLSRPMRPRNGMPIELSELLFVRGITAPLLYGDEAVSLTSSTTLGYEGRFRPGRETLANGSSLPDGDAVGAIAENRMSGLLTGDHTPKPWVDLLTIYSAERNETYTGDERVFLNQPDLGELHKLLSAQLPKQWADYVVLLRQHGPADTTSLASLQQTDSEQITIDVQQPAQYELQSVIDLIDTVVVVPAEEDDESPRAVNSPVTSDELSIRSAELQELFDRITTYPGKRIEGRVNVNEAPPEVLAALPGITSEQLEAIMSQRSSEPDGAELQNHPLWLLTSGVVDLKTMRQWMPHVTCGGDVFRAQVWGRVEEGKAMVRYETVVDGAVTSRAGKSISCQPVYYQERNAPADEIKILTEVEFTSLGISPPTLQNSGTE